MKIDYLSCTKMLFFAEKLLKDDYSTLPDVDDIFAKQFGMTSKEANYICHQFEFEKLIEWDQEFSEIENEYGEMISELSYDVLRVNKKGLGKEILRIKEMYGLRNTPFVPREAILSISKSIEKTLSRDVWLNVISRFTKSSGTFYSIHKEEYTLTDFLFRHAYAKGGIEPLHVVLSEFLNPLYYNSDDIFKIKKLYTYMNLIISKNASGDDCDLWLKEVAQYAPSKSSDTKELKIVKVHNEISHYITRKEDGGEYYFEGNRVYIKNKKAKYAVIFDVVFSLVPNGGKFEYKKVVELCKKRSVSLNKKSIHRALSGKDALLFRYVKDFKQDLVFGNKLFVPMQDGKHMAFNNKK